MYQENKEKVQHSVTEKEQEKESNGVAGTDNGAFTHLTPGFFTLM